MAGELSVREWGGVAAVGAPPRGRLEVDGHGHGVAAIGRHAVREDTSLEEERVTVRPLREADGVRAPVASLDLDFEPLLFSVRNLQVSRHALQGYLAHKKPRPARTLQ